MHTPASMRVRGRRKIAHGRHGSGVLAQVRALGLLVAIVIVSAGCGPREEIVYIDPRQHAEDGAGAYTPLGRSTDPLVHADGAHEPADAVQIGPAAGDSEAAPYTPIGRSGEPLVHADGTAHIPEGV